MKLGIRGQLIDEITCVKFLIDQFFIQGLRSSDTPKLPFPIDLLRRPYNSVSTAVRHCDRPADDFTFIRVKIRLRHMYQRI